MATLSALNTATTSEAQLLRNRLAGAQREASRAQASVQQLKADLARAQSDSQQRDNAVTSLDQQVRSAQAAAQPNATYSRPASSARSASSWSPFDGRAFLNQAFASANPATNTLGQVTGQVLSLSA